MHPIVTPTLPDAVLPLRVRHRQEMNCQIVHDSLHRRPGWTSTFALAIGNATVGFGSVANGGPWKGTPTIFEFYVVPAFRFRAFDLFEAFLESSGARLLTVQSNDTLLAVMLHVYARDIHSTSIVFRDSATTDLAANGATLECMTSDADTQAALAQRQGGTEWRLVAGGEAVATGGILFHYNHPFGDVYMDVAEPFRRRGFGSYLVQELKRIAYQLGSIPCARCGPANVESRKTLQKAGFAPYAHILSGSVPP
jgi:GNAT superfamily N-acetyltransferase